LLAILKSFITLSAEVTKLRYAPLSYVNLSVYTLSKIVSSILIFW